MADSNVPADIATMSFEDALEELEQIVRRLEGGPGQARRRHAVLRARRAPEAALRGEAPRGPAKGRQDRHRCRRRGHRGAGET